MVERVGLDTSVKVESRNMAGHENLAEVIGNCVDDAFREYRGRLDQRRSSIPSQWLLQEQHSTSPGTFDSCERRQSRRRSPDRLSRQSRSRSSRRFSSRSRSRRPARRDGVELDATNSGPFESPGLIASTASSRSTMQSDCTDFGTNQGFRDPQYNPTFSSHLLSGMAPWSELEDSQLFEIMDPEQPFKPLLALEPSVCDEGMQDLELPRQYVPDDGQEYQELFWPRDEAGA